MANLGQGKGTALRSAKFLPHYDNIIIGAGIGGLACATTLAMCGESVLVLEAHYSLGGYTHVFKKGGYEFNPGLHYDGQVGYSGHPLNSLFSTLSDNKIEWNLYQNTSYRIQYQQENDEYLIPGGVQSFIETLHRHFPNDRAAIESYVQQVQKCENTVPFFFTEKALPKILAAGMGNPLRSSFLKYARQTTADALGRISRNPKLNAVLDGTWYELGIPPNQSSFGGHCIVRGNMIGGTYFPTDGTSGLAAKIVPTLERNGGMVVHSAKVDKILFSNQRVSGVRLVDGTEIKGKRVISSAGLRGTYNSLLPLDIQQKLTVFKDLAMIPPSCSSAGLYLGVKGSREELDLPYHPTVQWPSYDYSKTQKEFETSHVSDLKSPYLYSICWSARDPSWALRHPDRSTIVMELSHKMEHFRKWADTEEQSRPQDYVDFKEKMKEYLLEKAYEFYPKIKGRVEVAEAYTPLTVRRYGLHPSGEIYGLAQTPYRFEQKWLRPDSPIPGLYFTGVDVCISSIVGAMLGGVLTTLNIVGPLRGFQFLTQMMPWDFRKRDPSYYR